MLNTCFLLQDLERPYGFSIQAKTKEETMEHAKAHMAIEHGIKEIPRETELLDELTSCLLKSLKSKSLYCQFISVN
jgi:predicted small metal-binding protein